MKKIILFLIAGLFCYDSFAQQINNKINIYFGYSLVGFSGKKVLTEGDFISTSLYANYRDIKGPSFKGLIELNPICSLGLGFDVLSSSNWKYQEYTDFVGSNMTQYSLSPVIQFHTKRKQTGITNRIRAYVEIAPHIGKSEVNLKKSYYDLEGNNGSLPSPMNSNELFFGVKGATGLEMGISNFIGLYIAYSCQNNWITSRLSNDKQIFSSQIGGGIFLKLKKDKRFFYK